MQVELDDKVMNGMIKNAVYQNVERRVNEYFKNNSLKEMIEKRVDSMVWEKFNNSNIDISQLSKEFATEDLFKEVSRKLCDDIASAYARGCWND